MQRMAANICGTLAVKDLPAPETAVVPGVPWGRFDHPLTPAFWATQAWMHQVGPSGFRLGETLAEEVAACLLGGHGDPAEVGLAAYYRVRDNMRDRGIERLPPDLAERLLTEPLTVKGRERRYRFARQRAKYLAASLEGVALIDEGTLDDVSLREALRALPGIGPKTASWIVRNRRASDGVAILDVHIVRACRIMGVFPERADPARGYRELEVRFLALCAGLDTRASVLDAIMWRTMRAISHNLYGMIVDLKSKSPETLRAGWGDARQCPEAAATGPISAAAAASRTSIRAARRGTGRLTAPTPPSYRD